MEKNENRPQKELSPVLINELRYLSLGYRVSESALEQDITEHAVTSRRKRINKFYGARSKHQAVVEAIHQGHLVIDVDHEVDYQELSPMQSTILHLVARGGVVDDIAKRCEISRHTVDGHYEKIRHKLSARNMTHSMRKAFEVGIFKVGEDILDPSEIIDDNTNGLQVAIDGNYYNMDQIGITNNYQVEVIGLLGRLGMGRFKARDIYDLGFYEDAKSQNARAHAFGRAILAISRKLKTVSGESILEKFGVKGQRTYEFRKEISIGTPEQMETIPPAAEEIIEKKVRKSRRSRLRVKPVRTVVVPAYKEVIDVSDLPHENQSADDYLANSQMLELDTDYLSNLTGRDPSEVLENNGVKAAVESILRKDLLLDYRSKVVIPIRYGVNSSRRSAVVIRRGIEYIELAKVMEYVPGYQGLDINTASQVVGLKPLALLRTEKRFISEFQAKYPCLKTLEARLDAEIDRQLDIETNGMDGQSVS